MTRKRGLVLLCAGLAVVMVTGVASASPVAETKAQYQQYGRVFLEPAESYSYIQFGDHGTGEFYKGFHLLQKLFPRYVRITTVAKELHNPDAVSVGQDGFPAWSPKDTGDGLPLYVVIATDRKVPDKNKNYMVVTAGHSAEPCGREGTSRFVEDVVTDAANGSTKKYSNGLGLQNKDYQLTAKQILDKTKIFFILPSPDGWLAGDGVGNSYSQYNGAGINSNRLAYSDGWVFPPGSLYLKGYTTYTQPEGVGMTQYLNQVRQKELHGKPFTVGMDMHGPTPAGFILLHDEGQTPLKLEQMLDLGLRVRQEMEETTPAFGPAQDANDSAGVGPLTVADDILNAAAKTARENTPDNRQLGTTDNTVERTQGNGRWAFITHIVDSALGYTAVGSWGGYFSSNSGLDATSLSYEINCRTEGPWLGGDMEQWINNTRNAVEAGVVTAAEGNKVPLPKVRMKKKVGFYEPGTRVTDADGSPNPPPRNFPGNPLGGRQLHQTPYNVENTDYFRDLNTIVDKPPAAVAPGDVSSAVKGLDSFVVDDTTVSPSNTKALESFVKAGGDLVLTDSALRMVPKLVNIPAEAVQKGYGYVGYSDLDRSNPLTYGLLDTAWQTYAPAPIGYPLMMARDGYWNNGSGGSEGASRSPTRNSAPLWLIDRDQWEAHGGTTIGTADPPPTRRSTSEGTAQDKTEIGTLPLGKGRIVIFGALLPQPTERYTHWFGLDSYSISEAGQKMLLRVLSGKY